MQPVAVSASAPVSSIEGGDPFSAPAEPFLKGSYAKALGRPRGHPALPDEEWDAKATYEEREAALKAALDEGFRAYEAGDYVTIYPGQTRAFIKQIGEEASQRLKAKRADLPY